MNEPPFRGYHDIGGLPGGPVEQQEYGFADWQKLSEAIRGALEHKDRSVSLDEIRRVFESFGSKLYDSLGFYERRAEALAALLNEKGILPRDVLEQRMTAIAAARGQTVDHPGRSLGPA